MPADVAIAYGGPRVIGGQRVLGQSGSSNAAERIAEYQVYQFRAPTLLMAAVESAAIHRGLLPSQLIVECLEALIRQSAIDSLKVERADNTDKDCPICGKPRGTKAQGGRMATCGDEACRIALTTARLRREPPERPACPVCGKPRGINANNHLMVTCGSRECRNARISVNPDDLVRPDCPQCGEPCSDRTQPMGRSRWNRTCGKRECINAAIGGGSKLGNAKRSSERRTRKGRSSKPDLVPEPVGCTVLEANGTMCGKPTIYGSNYCGYHRRLLKQAGI